MDENNSELMIRYYLCNIIIHHDKITHLRLVLFPHRILKLCCMNIVIHRVIEDF
jgi:hypothetical protein